MTVGAVSLDWGGILGGVLEEASLKHGKSDSLPLSKALKKAVKLARKLQGGAGASKEELKGAVQSFLSRSSTFILQDGENGKVVRRSKPAQPATDATKDKKKKKKHEQAEGGPAAAELAGSLQQEQREHTGVGGPTAGGSEEARPAYCKKSTKKHRAAEAAAGAKEQQVQQAAARDEEDRGARGQPQAEDAGGKKAKKKKRKAAEAVEPAGSPVEQLAAGEPPSTAGGGELLPSKKASKKGSKQRGSAEGVEGGGGRQAKHGQAEAGDISGEGAQQAEKQQKKKKKRRRKAEEGQKAEGVGNARQAAHEGKERKKKKKEQQKGADGGEQQQAQQQQQQQQQQKKKKQRVGEGGEQQAAQQEGQQRGEATHVAVLPPGAAAEVSRWRDANKRTDVKSGPFSQAEKDTLRRAVTEYAKQHGESTSDFSWLFARTLKRRRRTESAWAVIAAALPHRTYKSVWAAGTRMFHSGNYQGRFSADEDVRLRALVGEKGSRWKEIGAALGRMPEACKDRWKEIRLGNDRKVGRWSEEEEQKLAAAVQEYLEIKRAHQEGALGAGEVAVTLPPSQQAQQRQGGQEGDGPPLFGAAEADGLGGEGEGGSAAKELRSLGQRHVLDDIDWGVISAKVGTRSNVQCLEKWYHQLSPSMVDRGEWGAGDDRRMLRAIFCSGAAQDFELDWGGLVPGRTAAQARRRWRLMLKCVPGARDKEFWQVVDFLVDKYMPQLREQQQQ